MKKEFGFVSTFEATPVGPAGSSYEKGSAKWDVAAKDAEGNDASGDYSIAVDPENELRATVTHSGTTESTAVLSLRADGDPDADEEAPAVGTLDIVVDAPNVNAFTLSEVTAEPTPEPEPEPEPTPEPA